MIIVRSKEHKSFTNNYVYKFVKKEIESKPKNNDTQQISLLGNESSYREVPIDCPIDQTIELRRKAPSNNVFFFNFNELKRDSFEPFQEIQAYYQQQQQSKAIRKHRSLSTIFEEKSLNNYNSAIMKDNVCLKLNDFQLLDDIHVNHLILNEIVRVFQPSSKNGSFHRNIPIRLSSSKAKLNSPEATIKSPRSSLDSSLESKFSPISYSKATSPLKLSFNDTIVIDSFEESRRKLRLVKRLKNHIEHVKGGSISNLNTNNDIFKVSIFTNSKCQRALNERSQSESSLMPIDDEYESTEKNEYYDLQLNFSSLNDSNIRPYNNIRPVYF